MNSPPEPQDTSHLSQKWQKVADSDNTMQRNEVCTASQAEVVAQLTLLETEEQRLTQRKKPHCVEDTPFPSLFTLPTFYCVGSHLLLPPLRQPMC